MVVSTAVRTVFSGTATRDSSAANSIYDAAQAPGAAVRETDQSPTAGKNIPVVIGATKLTGEVIWIRTFLNSKGECRAHVAVCFGMNMFQRPIGLMSLSQGSSYIYRRTGGEVVDPPSAVRFYDGTHTTADPKIVSYEGATKTPAFKGYIYAVLENVKLGDFGFGAEFTDEGVEEPVETGGSNTFTCDDALAGINMVYNFENGWYYGIRNQISDESYFVRSRDGCRIFDEKRITYGTEYNEFNNQSISRPMVYDNVFPVRCSNLIIIPGMDTNAVTTGVPPETFRPQYYTIQDSSANFSNTGSIIFLAKTAYAPSQPPLPPSEPVADFLESYPIPKTNHFALLRLFDRDDNLAFFVWSGLYGEPGSGNIACSIFRDNGGFAKFDATESYCIYGRDIPNFEGQDFWQGWFSTGAPLVDDVFYGSTTDSTVRLGGVKVNQEQTMVTVYRIEHSVSDMTYPYTINIALPEGLKYNEVQYVRSTDVILVSATASAPESFISSRIYKVGLEGEVSYTILPSNIRMFNRKKSQEYNGLVAMTNVAGSEIYTFNSETDELLPIYSGDAPTDDPVVDLARKTVSVPTVTGYTTYTISQISPGEIPLTQILTDCCAIKGYNPVDIVFENLSTETVLGMQIGSTIRMADLFNRLGALFGFVFVETDQKLKFVKKRAFDAVLTDISLQKNDLVLAGDDDGFVRAIQRAGSNNLLGGMNLEFVNPLKNYENDTIMVRRPTASFNTGASTRVETLSVPVTLSLADAYALMYESFYTMLQRQTRVVFSVPSWTAFLEPGDCVSVEVDGVETTGIVVRVTTRGDFAQDVEMEVFHEGGSTAIAQPEEPATDEEAAVDVAGFYIPLEIPFIRATDYLNETKSIRYHGIASSDLGTWAWADVYRSISGSTFTKVLDYDHQPMTFGRSVAVVGPAPFRFAIDDVNTIVIDVQSGSIDDFASVTYLSQMNGSNLCAFGEPGRWEILSYQTVVENSDGTLTLSGLQRGLFGTHMLYDPSDWDEEHISGDMLIVLDPVKLKSTEYNVSNTGLQERFAIKTQGVELVESAIVTSIFENIAMLAFQPASLRATHTAGSNDLVLTWEHTTCVPSEWNANGGTAQMHAAVTYDIWIGTDAGIFEFTTTDRTYTWTGYGAELGPDSNAEEVIYDIYVTPRNGDAGEGFPAATLAVEI